MTATLDATGSGGTPGADLPPGLIFWRAHWATNGKISSVTSTTWRFRVPVRDTGVDRTAGTTIDVNGDGFADTIVGVVAQPNQSIRAYAFYGSASGPPALPSASLDGLYTSVVLDSASVASLGDINGDGYTDIGVGYGSLDMPFGGELRRYVSVFMGGPTGLSRIPNITLQPPPNGLPNSDFGTTVAGAGDVNGDGYSDFLATDSYNGLAYLYLGSASGSPTLPILSFSDRGVDYADGGFGFAASAAGDVDGDGYGDVVIGASMLSELRPSGYLFLGGPSPFLASIPPSVPFASQLPLFGNGNHSGEHLTSTGDINGDGFGDLIVGCAIPGGVMPGNGQPNAYTLALPYYGNANGLFYNPAGYSSLGPFAYLAGGSTTFDYEVSLANAGDVDGDGYADVVVGGDQFMTRTGKAYVYRGNAGPIGIATTPTVTIVGPDGPEQLFGMVVAGPGDVNGDGYSDVVVSELSQRVYVFPGGPMGVSSTPLQILGAPDARTANFGPNVAN